MTPLIWRKAASTPQKQPAPNNAFSVFSIVVLLFFMVTASVSSSVVVRWLQSPNPGRGAPLHPLSPLLQLERGGIDAIAQAGGGWTVVEYVAQVSVARGAQRFGAPHPEAVVRLGADVF